MAVQVTGSKTEALLAKRDQYVARAVSLAPIVADRAHGARLVDVDGKEYIDFAGGIGVLNLGHTPDAVVAAIKEQAEAMLHSCFPVAAYEPYLEVSRLLCELSPGTFPKKAVLINSGAEAVENAVKIARYHTGRDAIITFDRGFHGRTLLTMTLTSKLVYKKGMGPYAPEVYRAPAPYPYRGVTTEDALEGLEFMFKAHVDPESVAAVIIEPVQGEGGFTVMPPEFLRGLKAVCEEHGIVYIADEIQTGMGRTGTLWAIDHSGVVPDLMTVAKSLAAGLPLSAVVGRADIIDTVHPGGLGSTYGGNPVACAAAIECLKAASSDEFLEHSKLFGERINARLNAMAERLPVIGEVRGIGPMAAIELVKDRETKEPAADVTAATVAGALERGLLLLKTGIYDNVLRILVPIVATDEELQTGLDRLEESLVAAGS
ncbi:MAG: 4-aminobutyrate aminotransferase / (S)-3-amino-2-methylpropionate transaminase / 5-aminovalerate [Gaiellales bacterium]|jgi:4-aminobutyrate aminotransferase|nr:4-aminobutyrate aminotransferase / (S)-3-amino-2-methylpropionate transaminase / 5-aminovalerate [Gaiellales bacterium]MDX6592913.1 4-aminobutyrate aminotransferase / (S)-3-amino-2-methylpropionate transaminase / 5-aminovalerate [Gaiellales bacterium]